MEFGVQCSLEACKQLDFLPFTCTACLKIHCKDHRFPDSHKCQRWSEVDKTLMVCQECNQILIQEDLLKEHLDSNCTVGIYVHQKTECEFRNCKNKTFIDCKCCLGSYCIVHRHLQDHDCRFLSKQDKEDAVSKKIKLPEVPLSTTTVKKAPKWNPKVELMKLKSKATGDPKVPANDRLYFTILLTDHPQKKEVIMYFSKDWTIGKLVDKVAAMNGIPNFNNSSSSPVI